MPRQNKVIVLVGPFLLTFVAFSCMKRVGYKNEVVLVEEFLSTARKKKGGLMETTRASPISFGVAKFVVMPKICQG